MKRKVVSVYLDGETVPKQTVASLKVANEILNRAASRAPEYGHGYDKCWFTITWEKFPEDTSPYSFSGRVDLQREMCGRVLSDHINAAILFVKGFRPHGMEEERYINAVEHIKKSWPGLYDFFMKLEKEFEL